MNEYQRQGYESRADYLARSLSTLSAWPRISLGRPRTLMDW